MMMDPSQMQVMKQMNKTGMMMGPIMMMGGQQWPMRKCGPMMMQPMNRTRMMGMGQGMTMPVDGTDDDGKSTT